MKINSTVLIILVVGLALRIFLSLSTFHPDIRAFGLGGQVVASGHTIDFYDYLGTLPPDNQLVKVFGVDYFIYPPAIYFYQGVFNFIYNNILQMHFINDFQIENSSDFSNIFFNLHLLLLKLPYLVFDIFGAILIYKFFSKPRDKIIALTLWAFNPISLYATYVMGQFDLIPAVFTLLSIFLYNKKRFELSGLALGFGIAFKIYPILLLPLLIFFTPSLKKKIFVGILGVIPYVLSILPFIFSKGFHSSALMAGQTTKSFFAQISISGGESIILYLLFLVFLYLIFFYQKNIVNKLWQRALVILLMFFIFTHFHPQWLVWITPLLIIDLVKFRFANWLITAIILTCFFASLFFFDPSLTVGLFAPVAPALYSSPSIFVLMGINPDINMSRSIIQTIFVASGLVLLVKYFAPNTFSLKADGEDK